MIDQPNQLALLDAMAATLSEQVVPVCSGGAQHSARVVANLCRILAREGRSGAEHADIFHSLIELLDRTGPYPDLVAELDEMIVSGERLDEILPLLLTDASRRAEIAKPGYTDAAP